MTSEDTPTPNYLWQAAEILADRITGDRDNVLEAHKALTSAMVYIQMHLDRDSLDATHRVTRELNDMRRHYAWLEPTSAAAPYPVTPDQLEAVNAGTADSATIRAVHTGHAYVSGYLEGYLHCSKTYYSALAGIK